MVVEKKNMVEQLVHMRRVARVTKGGKNFRISTLVVVGNEKGSVGFGLGKSVEFPEAIKKAARSATKRMVKVNLSQGRTIHHDVSAKYKTSLVYLRKASVGTGIVAGSSARYVFESLGVKDIVCKVMGSNPINNVKAIFLALNKLKTLSEIAKMRGISKDKLFYNNNNKKSFYEDSKNIEGVLG